MNYLVFCTFDLKGATFQDYQKAYSALAKLGLKKVVASTNGGDVVIPTTSTMGEFTGANAVSVRDQVSDRVRVAVAALGLKAELFLLVGNDWAWRASAT